LTLTLRPLVDYPTIWSGARKDDFQCTDCILSAMNNRREIAGMTYSGPYRAITWTSQRGVTVLPLGDYVWSVAVAINEPGTVGGFVASRLSQARRAAVWGSSGLIALDAPTGIVNTEVRDINNAGLVLVYAR